MTEKCFKGWPDSQSGRCCCNCQHQYEVMRHPWNTMVGGRMKGPVTVNAGWGCAGVSEGEKKVIFMQEQHSMCEAHEWKNEQR